MGWWQEWSVNGETRQMYESRWQHFVSRTKGKKTMGKLGYKDVPWPAEEGCSAEDLQAVLLSGTKVGMDKQHPCHFHFLMMCFYK